MTKAWMYIILTDLLISIGYSEELLDDPPVTCPIPIIDNGIVTDNNNEELAIGATLTVMCGNDYDISSSESSVCQKNRSYDPPVPTCNAKPCPVPTIKNGKRLTIDNQPVQPKKSIDVICEDGYVISGSPTITCVTNNIYTPFNLPLCNAQNCNDDTEVVNGKITGPTPYISPGSKVLIQCDQGYKEMNVVIKCNTLDDFSFSPSADFSSVCVAQNCELPTITDGTLQTSDGNSLTAPVKPGTTFKVACNDQYVLNPARSDVTCITLDKYNPDPLPQCKAQDCPERLITYGNCPKAKPGQAFVISCDKNYELSTEQEFVCVSGSIYSPDDADFPSRCKAKDCPLDAITNGQITGEMLLKPGTTATLTCGEDYQLEGNSIITCVAGDSFTETLPRCNAFPCPVPDIVNGTVKVDNRKVAVGESISAGKELAIVCNDPYALSTSVPVSCVTKNTFNPNVLPTCIRDLCTRPSVANGRVTGPSDVIAPDSTLTIQCDTGYVMSHSDPVICFSMSKYSVDPPTCDAQNCQRPDDSYITNGRFSDGQPVSIPPGQTYSIECSENYEISGGSIITCRSGTVFMEAYPRCNAKPCPKSAFVVPNGKVTNGGNLIAVGSEIKIACDTDYKLVGNAINCKAGSEASGDLPICLGYDCPSSSLPGVDNGDYSAMTFTSGQSVDVVCNEGYLKQTGTAKCLTRDQFAGELPSCAAQNCVFDKINFGSITDSVNVIPGGRIELVCDEGYDHSDKAGTYTCVTFKTYNPPVLPTCEVVPCPLPDIPNSVTDDAAPLIPDTELTVVCLDNYQLVGTTVSCVSGTKFSGDLPQCSATDCDPVPTITNGRVDTTSAKVRVGDGVTVVCDEHYQLSHTDIPTCITNELYDPTLPSCNDKDCGIPMILNGQVTVSSSSSTVPSNTPLTVKCDPGYDLEEQLDKADGSTDGDGIIKCVRANIFDPVLPDVTCVPQPCPTPRPDNANLVTPGGMDSLLDPGSTMTVKCHSRYQVSDGVSEQTVECVAANTFNPPVPTCQAKDCPLPDIENGSAGSQQTITPGEPILVTCEPGYDISISTTVTIRCYALDAFTDDNGLTSDTNLVPTCNPRSCLVSLISEIDKGSVTNTDPITPGTAISITCDTGYDLTPSTPVTCTTRLDTRNLYSGDLPTCQARPCPVPTISNGRVDGGSSVQPGKELVYSCYSGYSPDSVAAVYCVTDDQFSSKDVPKCIANCIADNNLIPNGYIAGPGTLKTGTEIKIECDGGFVRVDSLEIVTCVTLRQYNPAQPAGCKAVPCPVPTTINRGEILNTGEVAVGDILRVTCPAIYQLSTDKTITCISGDVYDPDISTVNCVDKPCKLASDAIDNGVISPLSSFRSEYTFQPQEKLQFSCNNGYIQDIADSWCQTDTQWSPKLPTCNPQPCDLPTIEYATITPTYLYPGTVLTVTCSVGKVPSYFPTTSSDVIPSFNCVTLNEFSLSPLPTCEDRACEAPVIPNSNYERSVAALSPGDALTVECDGNFTLEFPTGVTSVTCRSTTYWSNTDSRGVTLFPKCKARKCLKPIIENGIVSTLDVIKPGSTLELNCGTGYVTPVVNTFKCVSHEIYEPRSLPKCGTTDCVMPDNFEHGRIQSPLSPGNELQITCDEGYALDCEVPFTCVTGNVFNPNSNLPQCKPKLCDTQQISQGDITGPDPITPGSFLTIQCKAGKAITTHVMPKCVHTNVFEPPLLGMECVDAINCTMSGYVEHGTLSTRNVAPGQYTNLLCDEGYSPEPANGKVYCVVGGITKPHYPETFTCQRTECTIPSVQNGLVTNNKLYKDDTLYIKCQNGYFNPYSAAPVMCLQGDIYSTNPPFSCLPVETCAVPDVSHGQVTQSSSLAIGSRVTITCDKGYFDPYNGDVRCTDVGTISHSNIACQSCDETFSNTDGVIHSPMYKTSLGYPPLTQCTYKILSQDNKHVKVSLDFVELEKSDGCTKDSLSFYDGATVSQDTLLYSTCGSEGVRRRRSVREITSSGGVMTVLFVSDDRGTAAGFAIGYAAFVPSGGVSSGVIAAAVIVPIIFILILLILLFLYCRYWRSKDESYAPHKNFHWKEGGPVDNTYFHFIANGGRKPPPTMATKLQATAQLPEDETESVGSGNSRSYLTPNRQTLPPAVSYSSIKLGQTASTINFNTPRPKMTTSPIHLSQETSTSRPRHRGDEESSQASSNFHHAELDNLQKYNHKKALEGLGLSEADFKLNIPASYRKSEVSLTESEEDSLTRTALEDTLLDGDPLQHTVLTDEVLTSPRTMRALEKFRAGARKHDSKQPDPHDPNYHMKKQNRVLSEEKLSNHRRAYEAGFRRPLPPSDSDV